MNTDPGKSNSGMESRVSRSRLLKGLLTQSSEIVLAHPPDGSSPSLVNA